MPQENNKFHSSIVIPIYNEINSLNEFCYKLQFSFKKHSVKFIFVDDGSSDGSSEWLKLNLKKIFNESSFDLIFLEKNHGKSFAIKKAIQKTIGEYTLFIDSDLEYQPSDLLEMYEIILKNKNMQVMYGSRNLGGKIQLRKYFLNAIAVRFNTWIFNFLFKQSISDLHTGTKIIKNSLLKKLSISSKGFGIEVDLSGQIAKKGIYIYEFGISYYERSFEEGKKITFLDGLMTYYYLFKSRFLQNDIYTSSSLIFSFITMGLMGYSFIEQGNRIFNVFLFAFIGLIIALNRRILKLSLIFIIIYLGIKFGNESFKIHTALVFLLIGIFVSIFISFKKTNLNNNIILRFFI